ncbi:hypothetical protein SAMN04487915_106181 [Arthrobacter sp. ov118]|nr:hypothetical protein SAMN04487915_106181 [Arthrobacter sp. ov118]
MRDRLDELLFGGAVLLGEVEVEVQLLGVAAGKERGDGDDASVALGELGPLPHLVEEDTVGVVDQAWREVSEGALAAGPAGCLVSHGFSFR